MIKTLRYLNLVFLVVMIGVNVLANSLPIGYGNTGAISEKYQNLFTPAPVTFFIWAIIYVLLSIFIIYQLGLFGDQTMAKFMISLIGPWFIVSCILNIGWIFSWHYDKIWLSLIIMLALLCSLIILTIKISPNTIEQVSGRTDINLLSGLSIYAFDIYLGWISAATIANVSVFLVSINWNKFGLSDQLWTIVALLAGALIGVLFIVISRKYMSALAIIWAYCGILIKHISSSYYGGQYPAIIAVAIIGIIVIVSAAAIKLILCTNSYE